MKRSKVEIFLQIYSFDNLIIGIVMTEWHRCITDSESTYIFFTYENIRWILLRQLFGQVLFQ